MDIKTRFAVKPVHSRMRERPTTAKLYLLFDLDNPLFDKDGELYPNRVLLDSHEPGIVGRFFHFCEIPPSAWTLLPASIIPWKKAEVFLAYAERFA